MIPSVHHIKTMRDHQALDVALSAMGDAGKYSSALSVAEQADERLRGLTPPPPYSVEIARILDAGELPADFTEWARIQTGAEAVHETERRALTALRDQAAALCWNTFTVNAPEILGHLHRQLIECVEQARPAAEVLATLPNAEAALRSGGDAVAAFGAVDVQWSNYLEIRKAQNKVMLECFDGTVRVDCRSRRCDDPDADDCHFSNMDQLWPNWRKGGVPDNYTLVGNESEQHNRMVQPWPERGPLRFVWFINNGAEFWVPTERQIEGLRRWRINLQREIELTRGPEWTRRGKNKHLGPEELRRAAWKNRPFMTIPA